MADLSDKIIGGFKVLEAIQAGAGSQGTVYRAECVEDVHGLAPVGTVVALKVMAVQDEGRDLWHRLESRTRELAALDHPNVVRYLGCFSEQGDFADLHVVVQEYLHGETMKERLARHPSGLDADEALRIVHDAIAGLSYTASRGIVHRDVKPGNIFLCLGGDGGVEAVKLIDFELARRQGGSATTSTGNIRGSFDYMAPDFTDPAFHGDVQSDVFSMGVVLHEALTGRTPYQRADAADKQANFVWLSRWSHGGESPIRISGRVKRLLARSDEVLARALAPSREQRYRDFDAFLAGLATLRHRELSGGAGRYRLLQFVGKGGFGEVFKARDMSSGRAVAVKHLLKPEYAGRFRREAKIMKRLEGACFVHLVDFFELDGGGSKDAFLVMDFLAGMPGSSLRDAIKAAKGEGLGRAGVFAAFERYARGLAVMHAQGLVHRDIKPSNLYFPAGRPDLAAIMDFGIARDEKGSVTTGVVPGTLDYMPPELVVTDSRGDSASDIYALGLCLYEALSGKTAFPRLPAGTAAYAEFFERARSKAAPKFDDPTVKDDAETLRLLREMTVPDPARRLNDASAVAMRLRELLGESADAATTVAEPDTMPTNAIDETKAVALEDERRLAEGRRRSRRRVLAMLGSAAGALIVLVALYSGWRYRESRRSRLLPAPIHKPAAPAVPPASPEPRNDAELIEKARAEAERKAAERLEARLAEERRKLEEERARVEAERKAEAERLEAARKAAEEAAAAERAAAAAKAEEERRLREAAEAEAKRLAEEMAAARAARAKRLAAEAEAKRLAEERRKAEEAEAKRKAEEAAKARRLAEEKRKAEEAEARRRAAEEAEAKRLAEEKRMADEAARRKAEEEARAKRLAEEQAKLDAIAKKIKEAEEAARKAEERRLADEAARKAAEERRRAEAAKKAGEASSKAAHAREMYGFEEYRETVRGFCEAKRGGYALTPEDMRMAEAAYKVQKRHLDQMIESCYRLMAQGRAIQRPLKEIEDERSELVSWYREIRSAR